jgi:flagellin-like hook-associated protein FlgL
MQLSPAEKYPIVRQLDNVNDTATYYVEAVIKNAYTGATLATVKLTDQGQQYFSAIWEVPNDVNGNGTYITITTFVYTDPAYTQLSTTYATDSVVHVIQLRPVFPSGMGGGTVDYARIERTIKENRPKDYDDSQVKKLSSDLDNLSRVVSSWKFPDIPDINSPLEKHSNGIIEKIETLNKRIDKMESIIGIHFNNLTTAHNNVLNEIHGIRSSDMASLHSEIPKNVGIEMKGKFEDSLQKSTARIEGISKKIDELADKIDDAADTMAAPIRFEVPRLNKRDNQISERVNKLLQ